MKINQDSAETRHENVPCDWYFRSIRENILQNFWHGRRFAEAKKLITPVTGEILDIGSADGMFSKVIFDKATPTKLTGIDVLKSSVDWANRHWRSRQMVFKVGDIEKMALPKSKYAAVFALEVLEHIENSEKLLKKIKSGLKKDGYAIFLVPTDSILFQMIWYLWTRFRGKIWKDTHIQTFQNDHLLHMIKRCGLKIEKEKKFLLGMLQIVKVRK